MKSLSQLSTEHSSVHGIASFLEHVFTLWDEATIDYVVLRNYEGLPTTIGNDLDILVEGGHMRRARQALQRAAEACGFIQHNEAAFSTTCTFWYQEDSRVQIQIDLFDRLSWHSIAILPEQEVLAARQRRDLFWIPHPAHEAFVNFMHHYLYQGSVREKYRRQIQEAARAYSSMMTADLYRLAGDILTGEMIQQVREGAWTSLAGQIDSVRHTIWTRAILKHPYETLQNSWRDVVRLTRRWIEWPGLFVVFLGPDGSGKSSVIQALRDTLYGTFKPNRFFAFHWKPALRKGGETPTGAPVTDPHGRPCRNPLLSLVFLVYHWLGFMLGGVFALRPVLFRNSLLIADRYYPDMIVDSHRYRLNVPAWILRFLYRFVLQPDVVILLDAPTDVLRSRKQEVCAEEIHKQREKYQALVTSLPGSVILDASRPLNEVVLMVTTTLLERMTLRLRNRGIISSYE